ncbi:MAG: type IX secretion system membrane protein PorP/SprF, partial [Sphingobacteriales bacterium]
MRNALFLAICPTTPMKKILYTAIAFALTAGTAMSQQLPQFSHYSFNGMFISPAYAGITGHTDLMLLGRYQWVGYDASFGDEGGGPRTGLFTASIPLAKISSGIGVQVMTDELGPDRMLNAALSYAYHIKIGESKLGIGVQGGVMRMTKDGTKYRPNQDNDGAIFKGIVHDTKFDAGAGVWFHNDRLDVGAGITNLTEAEYQFIETQGDTVLQGNNTMARHIFATAAYGIPVSENVTITPTGIIKYAEEFSWEVGGRATFNDRFWVGTGYRDQDAIAVHVGTLLGQADDQRHGPQRLVVATPDPLAGLE